MSDWICGIHRLPAFLDRDPPVQLTLLVWMEQGRIRSFDLYESPRQPLDHLVESFAKAIATPVSGRPGPPARVRVASEPLARKLAGACGVAVEIEETPELEEAITWLEQYLTRPPPTARESLEAMPEEHRHAFLYAVSEFLARMPWLHCEPETVFGVRIPTLGLRAGAIAVMGHDHETLGFMLFETVADFELFVALAKADQLEAGFLPHCFSVSCDVGADESEALPEALVIEGRFQRAPAASELRLLIACAMAMTRFMDRRARSSALREAWRGERPVTGRYKVRALGEEHTVHIRAPAAG